ncbi:MAG: 50S ribosomal protein L25/general stress protein Ctc [Steroidobacteraceae bacterium]
MRVAFEINAAPRDDSGKGASRRLRRAGRVPAILYGGGADPKSLSLDHAQLLTVVGNEKFYSSIINLKLGDAAQPAIVKDLQMHPARNMVVHLDLQRVLENERIRLHVPIHFKGEAGSPGVKTEGGVVSHRIADVEVQCLPKDLPEFLELDLSEMHLNETKFLSDIPLPPGVELSELKHGNNVPVVNIHSPRAAEPEPVAEAAAATPAAGEAAAPAAAGAAPAAPAADAKKDAKKG